MNTDLIKDTQMLINFISEMTKIPFLVDAVKLAQLIESMSYVQLESKRIVNIYITGVKTEKDFAIYDLLSSIYEEMEFQKKILEVLTADGGTNTNDLAQILYLGIIPNFIVSLSDKFLRTKELIGELKI